MALCLTHSNTSNSTLAIDTRCLIGVVAGGAGGLIIIATLIVTILSIIIFVQKKKKKARRKYWLSSTYKDLQLSGVGYVRVILPVGV